MLIRWQYLLFLSSTIITKNGLNRQTFFSRIMRRGIFPVFAIHYNYVIAINFMGIISFLKTHFKLGALNIISLWFALKMCSGAGEN